MKQPAHEALHRSLASGFQQKRARCSWLILIKWKPLILLKMPNAKRRIIVLSGPFMQSEIMRMDTKSAAEPERAAMPKPDPASADRSRKPSGADKRDQWLQDVLEDDEVRVVLGHHEGKSD